MDCCPSLASGRHSPVSADSHPSFSELGNLPDSLLSAATHVEMQSNQLTGAVPTELGRVSSLIYLDLSSNLLAGRVPSELASLPNLFALLLSSNTLTGSLPIEFDKDGAFNSLLTFDISKNMLTGTMRGFGKAGDLFTIILDDNQLSGQLPSQLGMLPTLAHLGLRNNNLTGSVPSETGGLSVSVVQLDNNFLTGSLPTELGLLRGQIWKGQNLEFVRFSVSNNSLTGSVPSELGLLASNGILVDFNISGNPGMTGVLPEELCSLQNDTSCEYKVLSDFYPCLFNFDCTETLCGCQCECSAEANIFDQATMPSTTLDATQTDEPTKTPFVPVANSSISIPIISVPSEIVGERAIP